MKRVPLEQIAEDDCANTTNGQEDGCQRERTCQDRMATTLCPTPACYGGVWFGAEFICEKEDRQDHGDRFRENRQQNKKNVKPVPQSPLTRQSRQLAPTANSDMTER